MKSPRLERGINGGPGGIPVSEADGIMFTPRQKEVNFSLSVGLHYQTRVQIPLTSSIP